MYELVPLGEMSYYINSPAKIGVYVPEPSRVYLIDSGNDKDAGRKIRQILEREHWTLAGILNTHSNADHIGGNKYLQAQTGCKAFTNGIEAAFTRHPVLEPSFLYGAYPCKALRHKFLMAQESEVVDFSDKDFPQEVKILPLPGHFFDMVGFMMPDGTAFLADCVSSRATLEKYGIPFIYDVAAYLKTLDFVETIQAERFVPSHADICGDIRELVCYNREHVLLIAERLLELCKKPICFEDALAEMFRIYELTMSFEQYALVGSTIRSFLSYLLDGGQLAVCFENNKLLWQKA